MPLYQRRRNIQRPLFVQQSHRKRAKRRVVKSTKFQGNSAGLLLYHANISRGPCIQMWRDLFRTRDKRGPVFPLSTQSSTTSQFSQLVIPSYATFNPRLQLSSPQSFVHLLLTSVGGSSKQFTPSCLLTGSTAATLWWWRWLRMSTSEN
jgi:hypothetical protein